MVEAAAKETHAALLFQKFLVQLLLQVHIRVLNFVFLIFQVVNLVLIGIDLLLVLHLKALLLQVLAAGHVLVFLLDNVLQLLNPGHNLGLFSVPLVLVLLVICLDQFNRLTCATGDE